MNSLVTELSKIDTSINIEESDIVEQIKQYVKECGYTLTEVNTDKPWGSYFRFGNKDTNNFLKEFFPGQILNDHLAAGEDVGLSLKILLVLPGQGLSWQYHNRRSEIWSFLTQGGYKRSMTDKQSELREAQRGDVVQFAAGERHRLVGSDTCYTIVAEIWQHSDLGSLSDEEDIVRLIDDYSRISKKNVLKDLMNQTPKSLLRRARDAYSSMNKRL